MADTEIIPAIPLDLKKFSEIDKTIAEMATQASMLKITDIDSKEQFDKVHDTRMTLVKMRTQGIDVIEAELKAPHLAFNKAVGEEASKRREQLKAIEKGLQEEEDKVNAEKERIKKEKLAEKQKKIQERLDKIHVYGWNPAIAVIQDMSDEKFEALLNQAKTEFEEKKAKEEKEKQEREEEDKKRKEAEEKLRKEQEELKEKQDEIARKEKEIKDAQDKIDEEKRAQAQKIIDDQLAKEKAEKEKEENDRKEKERLEKEASERPEREKMIAYIEALKNVPLPVVENEKYKRMLPQIQNTLQGMETLVKTA